MMKKMMILALAAMLALCGAGCAESGPGEETAAPAEPAGTEAALSETDRALLTLTIDGVDCVLGVTTPSELQAAGLYCTQEADGTVSVTDSEDPYGYVYARTADGTMDSPIVSLNAFWAWEMRIEYCGAVLSEPAADENAGGEDFGDEDAGDGDEPRGIWDVLAEITGQAPQVETSEEGISSAVFTLSDGRRLTVSEHDSPVYLELETE